MNMTAEWMAPFRGPGMFYCLLTYEGPLNTPLAKWGKSRCVVDEQMWKKKSKFALYIAYLYIRRNRAFQTRKSPILQVNEGRRAHQNLFVERHLMSHLLSSPELVVEELSEDSQHAIDEGENLVSNKPPVQRQVNTCSAQFPTTSTGQVLGQLPIPAVGREEECMITVFLLKGRHESVQSLLMRLAGS
eukprot:1124864-Pelagomonas_calceolata.AAC.3